MQEIQTRKILQYWLTLATHSQLWRSTKGPSVYWRSKYPVSCECHIRKSQGLQWSWTVCAVSQKATSKVKAKTGASLKNQKGTSLPHFPFYSIQAESLLAGFTHMQGASSVFSKSLWPHPELCWSNSVGHFLSKLTQSVSLISYPSKHHELIVGFLEVIGYVILVLGCVITD